MQAKNTEIDVYNLRLMSHNNDSQIILGIFILCNLSFTKFSFLRKTVSFIASWTEKCKHFDEE